MMSVDTQQRPPHGGSEPPLIRSLKRWQRRLYLRRWLVAVAGGVLLGYVALAGLSLAAALAGLGIITIAAGALPREGVLKRQKARKGDRKRADEPLEAIGRLIDGLSEPAMVLSRQGVVLRFNAQAASSYSTLKPGIPVSTALRHPQLLDAIDSAATHQRHQVVSLNEVVPVERWLSAAVSWIGPPRCGSDDPAIFVFVRDLTEQERIGQMRADFVANASHELKTPLASVLGFIETLRGPARDDEKAREEFLGIMAREAERMKRIINDLLSLSRVEMKAHLRPTDPVEINEIIEYARASLERAATAQGVSVSVTPFDQRTYVLGEREGLVQVFENLVNNAIKYGHDGGSVRIVAARSDGKDAALLISVIDDGPGIPDEHLPRLTERFYRVNVADSRDRGGTGLGLSIVKHVLNRHRGQLRIVSKPGEGSRFTVVLPEHTPPPGIAAGKPDEAGAQHPSANAAAKKDQVNQTARLS